MRLDTKLTIQSSWPLLRLSRFECITQKGYKPEVLMLTFVDMLKAAELNEGFSLDTISESIIDRAKLMEMLMPCLVLLKARSFEPGCPLCSRALNRPAEA